MAEINNKLTEQNIALIHAQINLIKEQLREEQRKSPEALFQNHLEKLHDVLEELLVFEEDMRQQGEQFNTAQEDLQTVRMRYQDLFNYAPDGYLVTDVYGKILEANVSAAFLLGLSQDQLRNSVLVRFIDPASRNEFRRYLVRMYRKLIKAQKDLPESKLQEFNNLYKSQQLKLYPASGSPFEASLTIAPAEIGAEVHLLWLIRDITSRKQAEKVNTDLLHRLVTVQEDQISHISRELHDQTGQKLTALILGLKNLENMEPEAIKPSLKHLQELADEIGQEVHQFSFALRPTALDDLNLTSVLANYTEEWSGRNLVEVDYQANIENDLAIPGAVKLAVYRIVLEALNNISRHAHASRVSLVLTQNEKQFLTIIEDDGSGFDMQNVLSRSNGNKHLGLLGMRERTQLVGGSLQIESEIGKGTSLFIKIPLVNGAQTKS